MYFRRRTDPLHLAADRLRGLRLSLNTPVLSVEELPVGPARAAIAVHEEPDGRPNVSVGVHSLQSGAVVLFSFEEDLREQSSLGVGVDAALTFGESMGFIFDEDEFEAVAVEEAPQRALGLWLELMGSAAGAAQTPEQTFLQADSVRALEGPEDRLDVEGLDEDENELLLDELAAPEEESANDNADEFDESEFDLPEPRDADGRLAADPRADAAVGATSRACDEAAVPLSKFRHRFPSPPAAPAAEESPAPVKGAALAQLKLVKRSKTGAEDPPKSNLILRLLSSF